MYWVYMLKDVANNLYIGTTQNIEKRLAYHNDKRGALFTKHGTFRIVFSERHTTMADARKREIQIKKWRRDKKEMLIERFVKGLTTI